MYVCGAKGENWTCGKAETSFCVVSKPLEGQLRLVHTVMEGVQERKRPSVQELLQLLLALHLLMSHWLRQMPELSPDPRTQ